MKKRPYFEKMLLLIFGVFLAVQLGAQPRTITGTVTDANDGSALPGATVVVKGTTAGTATNFGGNYTLNASTGDVLVYSFVGYETQEVTLSDQSVLNVQLSPSAIAVDEVVVIGYGTVQKDDATGSLAVVKAEDFNSGAITSPQELFQGKIAGVQITSEGGAPGSKQKIRIRGGSSLSASNDPLIVIDGVPVDNQDISGMRNPLNTIHPNDIESVTVLKDASATAIYGSRASNGVIIVTTKKGKAGAPVRFNYSGNVSLATPRNNLDVLDAEEYTALMQEQFAGQDAILDLLGDANTDWQSEILQNAISHDHNLSATGSVANLPFRASVGYSDQDGILKTSTLERATASLNLSPSLLDDHLKINFNIKGMNVQNRFADKGAVGSAVAFDPTQPVFDENSPYGGYFTWTQPNGDPITIATRNPLAQLEQNKDESTVNRLIGNLQLDYKFHFLPDLSANLNLGYDYSDSEGTVMVPEDAAWKFSDGGESKLYTQEKKNELLDFYLNYKKDLEAINSRIDVTAGYSYQSFFRENYDFVTNIAETDTTKDDAVPTENVLMSVFGRLNFVLADKYLLTFTLRNDGSSRFAEENRWGLFPSVALAWDIDDESFLENVSAISDLKLRLGYGVTGQQDITNNDYPYLASYTYSQVNAQYQFGNNYVTTLRPEGYDRNIKWEETTTYNIGLDFGFLRNRIFGSIDAYLRTTDDLINQIPVPAGTNLTNEIITNVGSLENRGVEFNIGATVVSTPDLTWQINFNATYNENEITKLTAIDDPTYVGVPTGDISGGVGNKIQIHSVGHPSNSFYVWEQVYDEDGMPIEGLYVDRDGDGIITSDDKYRYEKSAPDAFMGFSSYLRYRNLDFSFAGRINLGNYVYNNVDSKQAVYSVLYNPAGYLNNVPNYIYDTRFENPKYFSDYYVRNASFLRLDNATLGYNFNNLAQGNIGLRVFTTVQNLFVITNYDGLDPEVDNGIDNDVYPRPTTYLLGVSLDF